VGFVETKHVIILANSVRRQKRCIAGKELFPAGNGKFRAGKWIRVADPDCQEGGVSENHMVSESGRRIEILDIVEIQFRGPCNDPNHPEDWWLEPGKKFRFVDRRDRSVLKFLEDHPAQLWQSASPESVPFGYVKEMGANAASLNLIRCTEGAQFRYWKEMDAESKKEKRHFRFTLSYANSTHDFSVTDPLFTRRHKVFDKLTEELQTIEFAKPSEVFVCASLTPEFNGKQYKICATIFEP
jgi:hypothetical protein